MKRAGMWRAGVRLLQALIALAVLSSLLGGASSARAAEPAGPASAQTASFTLDNVELSIAAGWLPPGGFTLSEAGAGSQVATAASWHPFRELTVTVVPFGRRSGTEALPAASAGGAAGYRAALRSHRLQQGGRLQAGPTALLFGQPVQATRSALMLFVDAPVQKPVTVDEWVVQAGSRLWIVRASQEEASEEASPLPVHFDAQLSLQSETLSRPSSPLAPARLVQNQPAGSAGGEPDLPVPAWWDGDCDANNYATVQGFASYRLGAVYLGMPACGPRPWADGVKDVLVHFTPGGWGVLEWECVELSMRFLYLKYGINTYGANGSQVVWNYPGSLLVKIPNGTVARAPLPNDVLSYGSTSTWGHTSVVTASSVDASGNGTITVIEENASVSGSHTLSVSNWTVAGNAGSVSGWLYDPSGDVAAVGVTVGGALMGGYDVPYATAISRSYADLDGGPVVISSATDSPIVASIRDVWSDSTHETSSIQLMGLPARLLSTSYYFPAYNNVSLDDQVRFGNVGTAPTTVTVRVGGVVMGTYPLDPSQSQRVSYAGLDNGPVVVSSSGGVPIIASIRDSWQTGGEWTSYSQLMGLPSSLLSSSYYFPAYNNVSLDDQIRFGNVGIKSTTVTVKIGGIVMGTYPLAPNQSKRVSYAGVDSGPVVVSSSGSVRIIASIRDSWSPDGGTTWTSYSQLMGLPLSQLSTSYHFPVYQNVGQLDGQLRFGNVGTAPTWVTVTIGGVQQGSYYLLPSQSQRVSYAGLDSGPVRIESTGGVKIIASLRDSWWDRVVWTSYAQLMGLPNGQLSSSYYFPAYNNVSLSDVLHIAVP